jgi:hypothetical protein
MLHRQVESRLQTCRANAAVGTHIRVGRPPTPSYACHGAPRTHRPAIPTRTLTSQIDSVNTPPLQLTPVTADPDEAREWFEVLPAAMGIEGLVVKGASTRYTPGRRDAWVKGETPRDPRGHRRRGAGLDHPPRGRHRRPLHRRGRAGRGRAHRRAQARAVGPACPRTDPARRGHPWPDEITSYRWGGPDSKKPLIKVDPTVVVEVTADAATQAGQARHGMRYVRLRAELRPEDLPTLPDHGAAV